MAQDHSLPRPGFAEIRVTAASPDVARQVAQVLRAVFASTEQRSFPAGDTGTGTRLQLTVDTTRTPAPPEPRDDLADGPTDSPVSGARRIWP